MIRISALNTNSSSNSDSDDEVPRLSKEAQEEAALSNYNKSLECQKNGKTDEALHLLREITENDLLNLEEKDGLPKNLLNLKYCCYKNIALLFFKKGNLKTALDYYLDAAELDDTDVSLWNRIGDLACEINDYYLAVQAYKKGLEYNPKHWPCLDKLITILYAFHHNLDCLIYISKALSLDPYYTRGLTYRHELYKSNKAIKPYYEGWYAEHVQDPPLDTPYNEEEGKKYIAESENIANKIREQVEASKLPDIPPPVKLTKPLKEYTWLDVGRSLIHMYRHMEENEISLFSPVDLNKYLNDDEIIELKPEESEIKNIDPVENVEHMEECIQEENKTDVLKMDVDAENSENEKDHVENIEEYKSPNLFDTSDELVENLDISEIVEMQQDNDENKNNDLDIEELVKITTQLEESKELSQSELEEGEDNIDSDMIVPISDVEIDISMKVDSNEINAVSTNNELVKDITENNEMKEVEEEEKIEIISDKDEENVTSEKVEDTQTSESQKPKINSPKTVSRRRRTSLSNLEIWGWHSKRRSNRGKTGNNYRKERDDTINGTLKRIIPSYLHLNESSEENNDKEAKDLVNSLNENTDALDNKDYFDTDQEKTEVKNFWDKFATRFQKEKFVIGCDVITLIENYVYSLAEKWNKKWPSELIPVYLEAYEIFRLYIHHLSVFDMSVDIGDKKRDADVTLLYGELLLDQWLCADDETKRNSVKALDPKSLAQLRFVAACSTESDDFVKFVVRMHWLKILLSVNPLENEETIEILKDMLLYMSQIENLNNCIVHLPNCTKNPTIKHEIIESMLDKLERNQNLIEIVDYYEKNYYDRIVNPLEEILKLEPFFEPTEAPKGADRPMQFGMLLDSLWFLDRIQDCLIWAELCLNEALNMYLSLPKDTYMYDRWGTVIIKSLATFEGCINENEYFAMSVISNNNLPRLMNNLCKLIGHQIESIESIVLPLNTVTPWTLLHYILQYEEDRGRIKLNCLTNKASNGSDEDDDEEDIPPSMMVLFTGHKFLGRRKWCCINNGELLFFTLNVVMPKFRTPLLDTIREKISQHIEQIFYCLYQHPSKKNNKVRYLIDHNVQPQRMCWERAQQLYDFYRPDEIPDFDAYRVASISSETEGLLKRIVHLVPPDLDPHLLVQDVLGYIDGQTDILPTMKVRLSNKMAGLYYLLADYYFKNNEYPKALKYYTMDVCINPERLDSWAGMALARAIQLETKLNSCEYVSEVEFLNKARAVQSCFKHSLELSPNHLKLWIEYGSFVYSIHSFCSRLMKTEADTLSMEKFEQLESQKESLLASALQCFTSADAIWQHTQIAGDYSDIEQEQDERWLHQYMQGKIAEKQGKEPTDFMQNYMKANDCLYENYAQYPQKVNYNNPQHFAVEALEIFYRIHASILKYLELHERKQIPRTVAEIFDKCIIECGNSPFVRGVSKEEDEKKKEVIEENVPEKVNEDVPQQIKPIEQEDEKRVPENVNVPEIIISEKNDDSGSQKRLATEDLNSSIKRPRTEFETEVTTTNGVIETKIDAADIGEKKKDQPEPKVKEDPQEIMDRLMKQCMAEFGPQDIAAKDSKSGSAESIARRGSQESTTTTTTQEGTTATSTESSEDSSSSEEDSSSSSSSSDSSSSEETENSAASKISEQNIKKNPMSADEIKHVTTKCIQSLELCVCRFPQHYKALYRLVHYYFNCTQARDLIKCRQLLLGQYTCSDGTVVQGLFSERKNNNFFNGVWRIPVSDVDRAGSFAAHMSRCVTLLMQVLRASGDHRTLLDLCIQLRRIPDADKKYLRDSEREQLSQQALSLCLQSFRELLQAISSGKFISTSTGMNVIVTTQPLPPTTSTATYDSNPASSLLLDAHWTYQKAQKHLMHKETAFGTLLGDIYKQYMGGKLAEGINPVDSAVKFCQQKLTANRLAAQQVNAQNPVNSSVQYIGHQTNVYQSPQISAAPRKATTPKSSNNSVPRPRGRPKMDLLTQANRLKYPSVSLPSLTSPSSLSYYNSLYPMLFSGMNTMGGNIDSTTLSLLSSYQELLKNYNQTSNSMGNLPTPPVSSVDNTQNIMQAYINSYKNTPQTKSLFSTDVPKLSSNIYRPKNIPEAMSSYIKQKQDPKTKHQMSKDSILKAVYGKDKVVKKQEQPKKDAALFRDRPGISITPVMSASTNVKPPVMTSNTNVKPPVMSSSANVKPPVSSASVKAPVQSTSPGKTLQQKLAERQKQNATVSKVENTAVNYASTILHGSFNSPPAAHSRSVPFKQVPTFPMPAHTSPVKTLPKPAATMSKPRNMIPGLPPMPSSLTVTKTQQSAQHSQLKSDSSLMITQVSGGATSKLKHFRKMGPDRITTKPQQNQGLSNIYPDSGITSVTSSSHFNPPVTLNPIPQKSKQRPEIKRLNESVEIITLDD